MAIESALIPVCLPLIQFSLKQPERFVQRNRTKIIKNVSALRLGLQHTRFRSAFDDPPIIEQMPSAIRNPAFLWRAVPVPKALCSISMRVLRKDRSGDMAWPDI